MRINKMPARRFVGVMITMASLGIAAWAATPCPHPSVSGPLSNEQLSAITDPLVKPQQKTDANYDKIFPYYTMECSLSQLDPVDGKKRSALAATL